MRDRVLIVEDNEALRRSFARELDAAGYDVEEAHDYRDALEVLENGRRLSVLIVEAVLPSVNGFALARMARMRHHNIRVIYLTGNETVPMNEADGPVLHRPVRPDVLLSTVRIVCAEPHRA